MLLNGRRLVRADGESPLILLAIEDVTESRQFQRITEVTQGNAPIDDLLRLLARRICESLAVDRCTVLMLDEGETTLRARASHGLEKAVETQLAISVGEGTSGVVAATRTPLVVDDLDVNPTAGEIPGQTLRSIMAVPILSGGELRGVLEAGSESRRHFTERELDLISFAAERIAQALDQEARVEAERKAREALESEATAKEDFFTALSHELRTPLTSILGWTQLLEHVSLDPEMVPKAIQQIEGAARTLARLVDDMFDVSRLLAGKLSVRFEAGELRSVVEDSVKAMEPIAAQRGIRIETQLDPATISGDPVRLRQVFGNLLANAIKFSPANARIRVLGERDGNRVSVSVIDEGKGISAEFLPQLFRRFSQQEKTEYGGLGLGLSIAHHLVERHGGTIAAESEGEGKGATLRVTLPILETD
jgi:signal transduction histidine kinase